MTGQERVAFVQTGGTIDKAYPKRIGGYSFEICEPAVLRIFQKLALGIEQGDNLLRKLEVLEETKIVVTHGTDTLIDTALYLQENSPILRGQKTVVLTGAFLPETFKSSDADFNVGLALGAVRLSPCGIYVSMSGQFLPCDQICRQPETGRFVCKSGQEVEHET